MHAPSSTLISNVIDMSRWAAANVNRGELGTERILEESTYEVLWQPASKEFPQIGVGWFLGERRGHRTVSHGGSDIGYESYLVLVPDTSLGVVAMSNYYRAPVKDLALAALDVLLMSEPQP